MAAFEASRIPRVDGREVDFEPPSRLARFALGLEAVPTFALGVRMPSHVVNLNLVVFGSALPTPEVPQPNPLPLTIQEA